MKRRYLLLVIALGGLTYFLYYILATGLPKLLMVYPQYNDYAIIGLFASVLLIGGLLGLESNIDSQIEWQQRINWTKLILLAVPALFLCLFNLIPYVLSISSFQPLPRDFSLVMGVVAGYALTTFGVRKKK